MCNCYSSIYIPAKKTLKKETIVVNKTTSLGLKAEHLSNFYTAIQGARTKI
jgi:hypothetical protein